MVERIAWGVGGLAIDSYGSPFAHDPMSSHLAPWSRAAVRAVFRLVSDAARRLQCCAFRWVLVGG